jgi:tetratricopeptide (TPR) repeat protein
MRCIPVLMFAVAALLVAAETPSTTDPSDQRIAAIQKAQLGNPSSPEPHIDLAAEYCRKARDSEQIAYYDKAQTELESALKLSPGNYDAQKLKVTVLLGRHEYNAALKLATELNNKVKDDIAVWGLLSEINTSLGNNKEALVDAQWVLDIRPGSTLGFIEAARLREVHGDPEGAIEFYQEARTRTSINDVEERAWLVTQVARLTISSDQKRAEALFLEARKLNPASQLAIAGLAKVHMAEGNYAEAVALLETRYKAVQDARTLYDFAEALERAGRAAEASAAFLDFETKAQSEKDRPYNANVDLIHYYLDHKANAAAALSIAEHESSIHRDSETMAALTGACHAANSERPLCKIETPPQ